MGRVTRSRAEALLRAPATEGHETLRRWMDGLGGRLTFTEGPRLVDIWLVPDDQTLLAIVDGPDPSALEPLVDETANVLGVRTDEVELRMLSSFRDHWAFQGEPASPDPTRSDPRPTRWHWIDVGPDDRSLRIEFTHGVVDGLHHVDVYEDDDEVRVTVYLGMDHNMKSGAYVLLGIGDWTAATTKDPVGRRHVNDGADG